MLIDSNCKRKEISFVLQVTKLLNLKEINENNLLKLLRSEKVNDRMKAMVIKLQDLYDFNEVSRMLGEKMRSAIITSALNEKFEDFKEFENHKNLSCSKLINLINGNHKSFSEAEQAILEERKDIVGLGFNNAYEQYIGILSGHAIDITDPNSLRYLLKADKISWKDFMNRIQIGNLTSIDYELIAMKTCDPELFWSSLNNISFMIFPEDSIEIKLYMLEYMNNKDIKSYNLPAQLYFFKLLNGKFEGYNYITDYIYEKYKNNFDFNRLNEFFLTVNNNQ
jgi:metal-responsive CopG/Arc/MetJ family transcriptional regulator